jgi:ferric-dicitrate binding protein FerR (iron transport regulator)
MAWQRCGDVEYHVVEELEPRRPRRRRWALAGAAALVVAGGLAAGAHERARSPHPAGDLPHWRNAPHMHYGAAGLPPGGNG